MLVTNTLVNEGETGELVDYISDNIIDIMAITETWLSPDGGDQAHTTVLITPNAHTNGYNVWRPLYDPLVTKAKRQGLWPRHHLQSRLDC